MGEAAMLERISEGDERAFSIFFREQSPLVYARLKPLLRHESDIMEVMQEVFLRIWLYRDRLTEVTHLSAYLRKIAFNEAFTFLQKNALKPKSLDEGELPDQADASDPEAQASYRETCRLVAEAVDALPEQRKKIYRLSREMQLDSAEIAETLGLSRSYVRNALSAAQQSIREHLARSGKWLMAAFLYFQYFFAQR